MTLIPILDRITLEIIDFNLVDRHGDGPLHSHIGALMARVDVRRFPTAGCHPLYGMRAPFNHLAGLQALRHAHF